MSRIERPFLTAIRVVPRFYVQSSRKQELLFVLPVFLRKVHRFTQAKKKGRQPFMKTVYFADRTLRTPLTLCFKEKLELVKLLDRLKLDVIELPAPSADKGEQLTNKTLASVVTASTVSVCTGATEDSVDAAWEIVRNAKKPAMQVSVPVSTVRMEYEFHKKTPALIEMIGTLVRKARYYCETVEFTAEDRDNVLYRSYPGEKVEFSGSKEIKDFSETTINGVKAFVTPLKMPIVEK